MEELNIEIEKNPILKAYELFRSKNGSVNKEIFTNALLKAADPNTEVKDEYMRHIVSTAEFSDMKLSPETIKIYAILRGEQKIGDKGQGNPMTMSDQPLLAEVLYQQGDNETLGKLIEAHPNIFN